MQPTLFDNQNNFSLPEKLRPQKLNEIIGQDDVIKYFLELGHKFRPSILYGPPGSGKTTIAKAIAKHFKFELIVFNAVLQGVADLKKILHEAKTKTLHTQLLFIDEIHRFNKAQQDALLESLETSSLLFVGATTEKPQISLNQALLSRLNIFELKPLSSANLKILLNNAIKHLDTTAPDEKVLDLIANYSNGDARFALRSLEFVLDQNGGQTDEQLALLKKFYTHSQKYDASGNRHYDVISAFIKSVRGSDPDAALLWLAVMLNGGEDPVFIARRLMILASEDIGLANSQGLVLANQAHYTVQNIGMPEARITLAHATISLCLMPKSNSAYLAIDSALEWVKNNPTANVPGHLQSTGTEKNKYVYPHDHNNHYVKQKYTPQNFSENFYVSAPIGQEAILYQQWLKLTQN